MKFQDEFALLAQKYQEHISYQSADRIFVCCETMKDEIQQRVLKNVKNEIYALGKGDVWKIEIIFATIHIFYETDFQVEAHSIDGVSDLLREKCSYIVKKYDNFNVFP